MTDPQLKLNLVTQLLAGMLANPANVHADGLRQQAEELADELISRHLNEQDELTSWRTRSGRLEEWIHKLTGHVSKVFAQMLRGNWVDDHGHKIQMNHHMIMLNQAIQSLKNEFPELNF